MVTLGPIAIDRMYALNADDRTAQTVVIRATTPQQHAPYEAEIIQQTIKDVNIIKHSFRDILYPRPVAENLS
jgi:hypothetical protein